MVHYYAPYQMMEALINRSVSCVQKLGYRCKRSKESNTNIPGPNYIPQNFPVIGDSFSVAIDVYMAAVASWNSGNFLSALPTLRLVGLATE